HALLAGDGLAHTLSGAGVGSRALAAHRQTAAVTQAAVAADVTQTGNVLLNLATQLAFNDVFLVEQVGDPRHVVIGQLAGLPLDVDAQRAADANRRRATDPVEIGQRNVNRLVG